MQSLDQPPLPIIMTPVIPAAMPSAVEAPVDSLFVVCNIDEMANWQTHGYRLHGFLYEDVTTIVHLNREEPNRDGNYGNVCLNHTQPSIEKKLKVLLRKGREDEMNLLRSQCRALDEQSDKLTKDLAEAQRKAEEEIAKLTKLKEEMQSSQRRITTDLAEEQDRCRKLENDLAKARKFFGDHAFNEAVGAK